MGSSCERGWSFTQYRAAAAATAAARHTNGDKVACHGARALGHLLAVTPGAAGGDGATVEPAAVVQPLQVLPPLAVVRIDGLAWQASG